MNRTETIGLAVGVGLSALTILAIISEPVPAGPVTLPAAAPMAEQPKAPAKVPLPAMASTTAVEAKPASPAPEPAEPKAFAEPAAEQPKPKPASPKPAAMPVYSTGADRDCGDFGSHEEAQRFFLANGGPSSDPHKLDRDHDGLACESS